jgi:S1-C subfamily serine protease
VIAPESTPAPPYVKPDANAAASITEIPQSADSPPSSSEPEPGTAEIDNDATNAQIVTYEQAQQNPQLIDPQLHSLQEFMNEGDQTSSLGLQLREDQRKLNSGEVAKGLIVVGVQQRSAAATAGLHPLRRTGHDVAEGLAIAAALFFPPAVLAVPLIDQVNVGESYDMIIGVDGTRVTNYLDFEDRMRDIQPGEIVYLSVVRNGQRVQIPVHVQ